VLKLAGSKEPAPAPKNDAPPAEPATGGSNAQSSSDDKPFDAEPFNAGVEADENSDPKKFIEQLTGKLGQSLRKFNEAQGQPDFELEKFAINSLLSACHTSEMDSNDQDDIIKKIKTAGNDDKSDDNSDNGSDDNNDSDDSGDNNDSNGDIDTPIPDDSGLNEVKETSIFLDKPKKNNMFQPNSNDILNDKESKDLKESEKSSIFAKIRNKLHETFNQEEEMNEPMIEPQVAPVTKPDTVQPNIAPSRKNKPFLPMPDVKPDPKAKN
jgi:hypothetical protein